MEIYLTIEVHMSTQPRPHKPASKIEVQARIWRAVDRDAIAHRGDPMKAQAEREARKALRKVIDEAKAGQP